MDLKSKIILVYGPTASGKSEFAIKLAKKINGEIINADSMQVYKEFTILSSKPKPSEYNEIYHHLYGLISVSKQFSAGEWLKLAKKKIILCQKNNRVPIVVGGTGLYFNTITKGMTTIPEIGVKTRNKVRLLFKKLGHKKFYEKLLNVDPKSKDNILPTDTQRTQRAYEVFIQTKKSLFDWIKNTRSEFVNYEMKKIFLDIPRDELLKKIELRTNLMFKNNCIEEVKKFNLLSLDKSNSANKLIGVHEINKYLKGTITIDECKELMNIRTRQYAKRQNTWARGHMKNWNKLYSKNFSILLKKVLKVVS